MSGTGLPRNIQGIIFTEIIPQLIPEVNTADLIRLGSIVRKTNRTTVYEPLTDALRKIQWVKAVGLEAANIDQDLEAQLEPGTKCYLIAGYKLRDDALNKIRIKQRMNPAIDVLTYDDLIALTQKTVEFVRSLQSKS
jgi:hypothetical protein